MPADKLEPVVCCVLVHFMCFGVKRSCRFAVSAVTCRSLCIETSARLQELSSCLSKI